MFTPKRPSVLSTPNSARVTRSQSLKTNLNESTVHASGGGALNRISLTMSSIYNDSILESYKAPLPIKVNELLFQIKSKDKTQINATLLQNGHVCLNSDRKLFVWKLKKSFKNIQCNELSLPNSRSLIKPYCISIECLNNKDYVGICVTNEGTLRFWPSIFNEYLCVDIKIDLQGSSDEAAYLSYIAENFYLLATSNGNLWSILIENIDGKTMPSCKQIDTSSGFMSSVSRRVTSLIFGGGGGGSSVNSGLNRNVPNFKSFARYKNSNEFFLLIDKNLQKWKINTDNTLSMTMQINVEKLFYEEYLVQNPDSIRVNITFCDSSITKNSIYILALIEDDGSKFIIGEIDSCFRTQSEAKIKYFHIITNASLLPAEHSLSTDQFHLHAMDNQHAFYIYNSNMVVSFTGPSLEMSGESKFNTLGDRLIASNVFENDLIFFSINHGILKAKDTSLRLSIDEESVLMNQSSDVNHSMEVGNGNYSGNNILRTTAHQTSMQFNDISNLSMQSGDESMLNFKGNRQSLDFTFSNLATTDQFLLNRLKEAFQCYLKKEERESQSIIDDLLKSNTMNAEKKLDFLCVELSEKLIDDMPAHDPRWAELNNKKSMNTNLIISNQLKGKIRLHEYFLTFLKKFNLWEKLTLVSYNGRDIMTKLVFQEHGEKLQIALCIREQLYTKNTEFINSAIEFTTKNREDLNSKLIYPHDVFYRRVSKIEDIFNALYLIENDIIKVNSNDQAINYLIDATNFFIKLLKVAQTYRSEKQRLYEINLLQNSSEQIEYIRWTFLPIKEITNAMPSILNICIKQHKLCSDYGLVNCDTLENKANILQGLFELDSLIFDEHELRLSSSMFHLDEESNFKIAYDSLKTKLNEVFIKHKQIENAMKLAEKYVDFNTLVTICEQKSDTDLLETYLDKFANTKFSEYVVKHFMDKRKLNFLLKNQFLKRDDVSKFLDKYQFISWIKDLKNEKYVEAAKTLGNLGLNENDSYTKQKTLMSLSKLSLIANAKENGKSFDYELGALNRRLEYLSYIDHIANRISKSFGYTIDQISASKPEKLISLYINDQEASEIEFKKAFELIYFLNDDKTTFYNEDQMNQLRIEILVRSILADNWELLYDQDYPETLLNETKFFKTIYSLKNTGENLESLLDLKDYLVNHEQVEHLAGNKKFSYLLQACFELASC